MKKRRVYKQRGHVPGEHGKGKKRKKQVLALKDDISNIVIDDGDNDDWMKSLPGYEDEVKLHEDLAKKLTGRVKKNNG